MLTATNLHYSYGNVKALNGISLSFAPGQISCIMGRNGVGKTTLIRTLMGTYLPTEGTVVFGEHDLSRRSAPARARRGLGLVPQGREIFPRLTVEDNLRIGLESRRDGKRTIPDELFAWFPVLKQFLKRLGGDLSGGQQQQLSIARALAGDPQVLLLDEPTEGIQPNVIELIGSVLQRLARERGLAVVLVEQYLDFVRQIGDRFAIMNRGQVVAEGATSELSSDVVSRHLTV